MTQIDVDALVKTYRVAERAPGLAGALRGLLYRRRREVRALAGVSFAVAAGETLAVLGPNGAGKSTLVKTLSGILMPDGGTCTVLGRTPWRERRAHVRDIGVVFGQRTQLWWDLPVGESFDLLRDIYRVPAADHAQRRDQLVAALGVGDALATPARQLSLGNRMRCDLIAALLHRPRVLFLDEPTIGLDATVKAAVRALIARLNRDEGVTVLLTTHDLDDVEALCRRILVIDRGALACDDSLAGLRRRFGGERRLVVETAGDPSTAAGAGMVLVGRDGPRWRFAIDTARLAVPAAIARLAGACAVHDLLVEDPPIEELVARLYRGEAP